MKKLCDIGFLTGLLDRHGFHFSKARGQNFLVADWVPERIASEARAGGKLAVEVGPGVGCLTAELAGRARRVVALELDSRLVPVLAETVGDLDNVEVRNVDAMKADLREIAGGERAVFCANLPYNITSPMLTRVIGSGAFDTVTVMIQREVARRICARPGTAEYGAFGVFVSFYTEPERLFDVPPECFLPRPKVTSSVVRLSTRERPAAEVDEELFFRVVRAAFNQRRKTLANALSAVFPRELAAAALERAGVGPGVRGETLGIEGFAAVANALGELL